MNENDRGRTGLEKLEVALSRATGLANRPSSRSTSEDANSKERKHVRVPAYLTLDQLDYLDQEKIRIRRARRVVVERTVFIRALVEALRLSGLDLATVDAESEDELASFLASRLGNTGEDQ